MRRLLTVSLVLILGLSTFPSRSWAMIKSASIAKPSIRFTGPTGSSLTSLTAVESLIPLDSDISILSADAPMVIGLTNAAEFAVVESAHLTNEPAVEVLNIPQPLREKQITTSHLPKRTDLNRKTESADENRQMQEIIDDSQAVVDLILEMTDAVSASKGNFSDLLHAWAGLDNLFNGSQNLSDDPAAGDSVAMRNKLASEAFPIGFIQLGAVEHTLPRLIGHAGAGDPEGLLLDVMQRYLRVSRSFQDITLQNETALSKEEEQLQQQREGLTRAAESKTRLREVSDEISNMDSVGEITKRLKEIKDERDNTENSSQRLDWIKNQLVREMNGTRKFPTTLEEMRESGNQGLSPDDYFELTVTILELLRTSKLTDVRRLYAQEVSRLMRVHRGAIREHLRARAEEPADLEGFIGEILLEAALPELDVQLHGGIRDYSYKNSMPIAVLLPGGPGERSVLSVQREVAQFMTSLQGRQFGGADGLATLLAQHARSNLLESVPFSRGNYNFLTLKYFLQNVISNGSEKLSSAWFRANILWMFAWMFGLLLSSFSMVAILYLLSIGQYFQLGLSAIVVAALSFMTYYFQSTIWKPVEMNWTGKNSMPIGVRSILEDLAVRTGQRIESIQISARPARRIQLAEGNDSKVDVILPRWLVENTLVAGNLAAFKAMAASAFVSKRWVSHMLHWVLAVSLFIIPNTLLFGLGLNGVGLTLGLFIASSLLLWLLNVFATGWADIGGAWYSQEGKAMGEFFQETALRNDSPPTNRYWFVLPAERDWAGVGRRLLRLSNKRD